MQVIKSRANILTRVQSKAYTQPSSFSSLFMAYLIALLNSCCLLFIDSVMHLFPHQHDAEDHARNFLPEVFDDLS